MDERVEGVEAVRVLEPRDAHVLEELDEAEEAVVAEEDEERDVDDGVEVAVDAGPGVREQDGEEEGVADPAEAVRDKVECALAGPVDGLEEKRKKGERSETSRLPPPRTSIMSQRPSMPTVMGKSDRSRKISLMPTEKPTRNDSHEHAKTRPTPRRLLVR